MSKIMLRWTGGVFALSLAALLGADLMNPLPSTLRQYSYPFGVWIHLKMASWVQRQDVEASIKHLLAAHERLCQTMSLGGAVSPQAVQVLCYAGDLITQNNVGLPLASFMFALMQEKPHVGEACAQEVVRLQSCLSLGQHIANRTTTVESKEAVQRQMELSESRLKELLNSK